MYPLYIYFNKYFCSDTLSTVHEFCVEEKHPYSVHQASATHTTQREWLYIFMALLHYNTKTGNITRDMMGFNNNNLLAK